MTSTMSGGEALARSFAAHESGDMFGMGGFQLLPFYAAVRTLGMRHHLINDERTGAFAADAYARMTGRPGVCDATLGPGATNLVTALAESTNAGVPLIAVTGDTHRGYSGRHMTQETQQVEILRPAAKALLRVEQPERIPELVRRAYTIATSGRPGAVVLDVPEDVCHAQVTMPEDAFWTDAETHRVPARRTRPDQHTLDRAVALLATAERPVLLAGGGIHLSGAHEALAAFVRAWGVPVAHTMSGKGSVSCLDPLSIGLFGRYSRYANDLIKTADLVVVAGCKLGEIATERYDLLPPATPMIHIDVLSEDFGRTARPTVALWGDAASTLTDLAAASSATTRTGYLEEIDGRRRTWQERTRPRLTTDERPINVARLVHELNGMLPADAVLIADGGFAAHWTGLLYDTKQAGRGYVADRGLASIGYGVPGALGAALAVPDRPVVALSGDGGLNMSLGDLETLRRADVNATIVVVNNAASGYVKALQHVLFDGGYQSSDLSEIDYGAVASALGCHGVRIEDPEALAPALTEAVTTPGPSVVDVVVTRDPAKMLPGVDKRAASKRADDRIA
ncbi:thiamine pyrophosphate-binding protein [Micromonospora sp. NPDC047793]|uniref:thiamine pyrophosphate-binding protein n=1 Tax=unclassified Micromonospora TaxID=2617518 RepID=UPI001034C5DD|nr:thiamine pyrophosphate-binding protein [Verrucosispora sp. SN26_14.1]TBL44527.1 thiamine pyrophosphate-binding protein [Verrucosispora sp. SN26_14.1]